MERADVTSAEMICSKHIILAGWNLESVLQAGKTKKQLFTDTTGEADLKYDSTCGELEYAKVNF